MAFLPKDNPLNGLVVVMPKICADKHHLTNLVIWGACLKCGRSYALTVDETMSVWERVAELKSYGI